MSIRVCEHGQLARSCNICELESELAAARRETAEKVREACAKAALGSWTWNRGLTREVAEDLASDISALDLSPFTEEEK